MFVGGTAIGALPTGGNVESIGALLPILLIAVTVFMIVRIVRRPPKADPNAWHENDDAWYRQLHEIASNPDSPPASLLAFATEEWPTEPKHQIATLQLYRVLARNPKLAPDVRSGLMSRIASEEGAIRHDKAMARVEKAMKSSRGGGAFFFYTDG